MEDNRLNLFKCFSVPLMKNLLNRGLRYELIAIDPSSGKKFWLFNKDSRLNKALEDWSNNNPNK